MKMRVPIGCLGWTAEDFAEHARTGQFPEREVETPDGDLGVTLGNVTAALARQAGREEGRQEVQDEGRREGIEEGRRDIPAIVDAVLAARAREQPAEEPIADLQEPDDEKDLLTERELEIAREAGAAAVLALERAAKEQAGSQYVTGQDDRLFRELMGRFGDKKQARSQLYKHLLKIGCGEKTSSESSDRRKVSFRAKVGALRGKLPNFGKTSGKAKHKSGRGLFQERGPHPCDLKLAFPGWTPQ